MWKKVINKILKLCDWLICSRLMRTPWPMAGLTLCMFIISMLCGWRSFVLMLLSFAGVVLFSYSASLGNVPFRLLPEVRHQSWIKDQIIPSTTSDDETIIKTATYEGVIRKQATFASGPVTFTSQSPIPTETRMQSDTNQMYQVLTSGEVQDGEVTVIVQAEEAGVAGNLAAGAVLTLLSPLPGTGSTGAVAESGITGGADIESIAELLDRLLYVRRNPPVGGALHDYVIWAREVPGVSRAWAWDAWHGPGTVGLAWLYDDREDIIPTRDDLKTMEQYLFCHKHPATGVMVGKPGGIEVWPVQVRLKKIDLSIRLTPDSQANRNAVRANLTALQKTLAPGQMLPVSSLRTAIGMTSGIADYFLNIGEDTTSDVDELITIGEVTWLTA